MSEFSRDGAFYCIHGLRHCERCDSNIASSCAHGHSGECGVCGILPATFVNTSMNTQLNDDGGPFNAGGKKVPNRGNGYYTNPIDPTLDVEEILRVHAQELESTETEQTAIYGTAVRLDLTVEAVYAVVCSGPRLLNEKVKEKNAQKKQQKVPTV